MDTNGLDCKDIQSTTTNLLKRLLGDGGVAVLALLVSSCGGGGSTPTPSYTVGGAISSLSATGLVLANGNDTVAVTSQSSASTPFTFPKPVPTGSGYSASIQTQPAGQTCIVANGAGTMGSANVTSVKVTCGNTVGGTIYNLTGSGLVLANGTDTVAPAVGATSFAFSQLIAYGATYSVTVQAQPASEMCGVAGGNGSILSSQNVAGIQVPCAQANASSGSWVLQAASKGAAVYGTQGVPAPDNIPGLRSYAVTWVDASGNFWLFGGFGYGTALVSGAQGNLNDLWKYDPGSRQWTWMSGVSTAQRGLLSPPMFPERAKQRSRGPTAPAISGFSAVWVTTLRARSAHSTIFGDTVPPPVNGLG
jgi:hypothetical protein